VTIDVNGRIKTTEEPPNIIRSVDEPSLFALYGIGKLLKYLGVTVVGGSRIGRVPGKAVEIGDYTSKPLSLIVRDMNKVSSNFMAESLLKILGAEVYGPPGTTRKGLQAVRDFLHLQGIATDDVFLDDASGLSGKNRATAKSLAQVLVASLNNDEYSFEMVASLPMAGVDGTLKTRPIDPLLSRAVRAKTGRTKDAVTLSGYILPPKGKRTAFSILINNHKNSVWKTQRGLDRICNSILSSLSK
jgi:D-alanyl-D-alanine carboxypeptidase/D-alanyl-D-alanine-endopeptidase (penicillin-binding protein 4)